MSEKRLKANPPIGNLPVLQFLRPTELLVDSDYQRTAAAADSKSLIRRIAQDWNWDLCQPLVVSRRVDQGLFVIDGQHRLEAAKLRGDIQHLPCVVVNYANSAEEAAGFVKLNQVRRPLSKLEIFRAAIVSGDEVALAIVAALERAGLSLARHSNTTAWLSGTVGNIGGIQAAWRKHGAAATSEALQALSAAFEGEVLRYAGTIFPGIVAVCAEEMASSGVMDAGRFARFTAILGAKGQNSLRENIALARAEDASLGTVSAASRVICEMWWPERADKRSANSSQEVVALTFVGKTGWCDQCDMKVTRDQASGCKSRFCSVKSKINTPEA